MSIPGIFYLKNCIYLFSKHTGHTIFPCWPFSTIQYTHSVKNLGKIARRFWELENLRIFAIFGANLGDFSFKKLQLSFHKRLLDNKFWPDERSAPIFQSRDTAGISTEISKQLWKWENFGFFVVFAANWNFFIWKTIENFSEKPFFACWPF